MPVRLVPASGGAVLRVTTAGAGLPLVLCHGGPGLDGAAALPDVRRVVIDEAGHFPRAEQPAAVAAAIRDFVARRDPDSLTDPGDTQGS